MSSTVITYSTSLATAKDSKTPHTSNKRISLYKAQHKEVAILTERARRGTSSFLPYTAEVSNRVEKERSH